MRLDRAGGALCWKYVGAIVRGFDGTVSFVQPLIAPLYGGKTALEVIATFGDQPDKSDHDLVQAYWQGQAKVPNFDIFWQKALHDGVVPNTALAAINVTAKMPPASHPFFAGMELYFGQIRPSGTGSFATTAGCRIFPPANKMNWANAVWISPSTSQQENLNIGDVVELKYQGRRSLGRCGSCPATPITALRFTWIWQDLRGQVGTK